VQPKLTFAGRQLAITTGVSDEIYESHGLADKLPRFKACPIFNQMVN